MIDDIYDRCFEEFGIYLCVFIDSVGDFVNVGVSSFVNGREGVNRGNLLS